VYGKILFLVECQRVLDWICTEKSKVLNFLFGNVMGGGGSFAAIFVLAKYRVKLLFVHIFIRSFHNGKFKEKIAVG
jgi:hypothetical protein